MNGPSRDALTPRPVPRVTVFTPTFNRINTIGRVFQSLVAQTCGHELFEWVVIDDGSTDGTEGLIREFSAKADFDIVYRFQRNQGKHIAHNHAVGLARGDLFLDCDSDDEFDAQSIAYFLKIWDALSGQEREKLSGISVRCRNAAGRITTPALPSVPLVSNNAEVVIVYDQIGDSWGILRTDILRSHLFPANWKGSHYPELIHWNVLGRKFNGLYTNEVLYTVHCDARNSITRSVLVEDTRKAFDKILMESADFLNNELRYALRRPGFFLKRILIYNHFLAFVTWDLADDQRLNEPMATASKLLRPLTPVVRWWTAHGFKRGLRTSRVT